MFALSSTVFPLLSQWQSVDPLGRPLYHMHVAGKVLESLRAEPSRDEPHGTYGVALSPEVGADVTYMLAGQPGSNNIVRNMFIEVHACPDSGCPPPPLLPPPPPPENTTRLWSLASTLNGTQDSLFNPMNILSRADPTKLALSQVNVVSKVCLVSVKYTAVLLMPFGFICAGVGCRSSEYW